MRETAGDNVSTLARDETTINAAPPVILVSAQAHEGFAASMPP